MDQLGSSVWNSPSSSGTFFPWGEAKGGYNPQDTWNFATYWQDSASGLDYANNRYYANAYGRFMTPDPSRNSNAAVIPQNWNRYAYVGGDPVNKTDPEGLCSPEHDPPCYSVTGTGIGTTGSGSFSAGGEDGSFAGPTMPWDKLGMSKAQYVQYAQKLKRQNNVMNKLPKVVGLAEKALDDPKCADALGFGKAADGSSVSAGTVLFDMFNNIGGYGTIAAGAIDSLSGTVTNAQTTPGTSQDANGGPVTGFAEIVLNDVAGSSFVTGTTSDQVLTILHELGHAMDDIFGSGTNLFINTDGGNTTLSKMNDDLIRQFCNF